MIFCMSDQCYIMFLLIQCIDLYLWLCLASNVLSFNFGHIFIELSGGGGTMTLTFASFKVRLLHITYQSRLFLISTYFLMIRPPWGPGGLSRECAPPYPQRDRKRRLNGAVCRNHRIKRVVPCRCKDGHVKEPYEMSMALGARP